MQITRVETKLLVLSRLQRKDQKKKIHIIKTLNSNDITYINHSQP